jgi:formylglycine-generating enzyme required for sulfatase activity
LDRDEFTVGQYRALRAQHPDLPEPLLGGESNFDRYCTYAGPDTSANDALPLNCVAQDAAERLCAARGMRLPTEAEWEYAAGNRDRETTLPWTEAGPVIEDPTRDCLRVVYALGDFGSLDSSYCQQVRPEGDQEPGPRPGGGEGDVTELGVRNLAGNVAEWVGDAFALYIDDCWGTGPWLVDPKCERETPAAMVRGGSWQTALSGGTSSHRGVALATSGGLQAVGFRCALDALASE